MRSRRLMAVVVAVLTGIGASLVFTTAAVAATGPMTLTATSSGGTYAPTFTGNGFLGVRVPPAGEGYAPVPPGAPQGAVASASELAGFYAQPPGQVQKRANIPTWSGLQLTPLNTAPGTPSLSNWRQSLDLQTGMITTTYRATQGADVTDISYQVLTDRARPNVGLVQMQVTPHWSGLAEVTDLIDGTPADESTQVSTGATPSKHLQWVTIKTQGTGIVAALASQLATTAPAYTGVLPNLPAVTLPSQSVAQHFFFSATAGQTYTFTKYVGVDDAQRTSNPTGAAQSEASTAAAAAWPALVRENNAAWAKLWRGRIDITGNRSLAAMVNASEFYLWSSTRAGVDWSISPAGLSSNGYNGHIFWDAETWMYPSLLAMHPDLAVGMDNYRFDRLTQAEQHATATGYRGARFPWESALDGTEQIPPPVSVNSEGLYEQHITSDIALAQWEYYLATGNRSWLRHRGWPVLSKAAAFWASRVTRGADGSYHITHVTGPDEENPNVNDEVYTNWAAAQTLQFAVQAGTILHHRVPTAWSRIAARLVVPVSPKLHVHPEFRGYAGQLVKQADVTLLQYPWARPMPRTVATNDLNYYVPRTDPNGPSMTDAIGEIDTSALGTPGCASYVFTERSYEPFIRDPFDQFSETRTGGAFTFMTGIGGFLQEFIYGYSGLRFGTNTVTLAPSLTSQLRGVTLRGLHWRGRTFTIAVGPRRTTVTLTAGRPLRIETPGALATVRRGHRMSIPTRRPDRMKTSDPLRCTRATATTAAPGAPALAAVDGSPATGWQPTSLPATLTVPVRPGAHAIRRLSVRWARQWPQPPSTPNVPPPPGPVITLRPASYQLQVSLDGHVWTTVATVGNRSGDVDTVHFTASAARAVRIVITSGVGGTTTLPMVEEITAGS
jgi:trehalose/maltose hydrolase-like predicted phosphorylase